MKIPCLAAQIVHPLSTLDHPDIYTVSPWGALRYAGVGKAVTVEGTG